MAHYAFLNSDNVVVQVIKGKDENESPPDGFNSWEEYYGDLHGKKCLRTSYNTMHGKHYAEDGEGLYRPSNTQEKALRYNFASVGSTYDALRDGFFRPKPFDSWLFDEKIMDWVAPVPRPDDWFETEYTWSEDQENWKKIEIE